MTTPRTLREWQVRAQAKWLAYQPKDFLVCATPAAGKTRFALTMAKQLLDQGTVEQVVIVVPTDALRLQWAVAAAAPDLRLNLVPVSTVEDYDKWDDYDGIVVTYAQLVRAGVGADAVRQITRRSTLAILDEIHHAGEQRSWGEGLKYALEFAVHRISLTGTPWRRKDYEPIPFAEYDDVTNKIKVDHTYEYGEAVADGVCRRIEFHSYVGSAKWAVGATEIEAQLGEGLARQDLPGTMDAILDPNNEWMPELLDRADRELSELREQIPDAGGLVVADTVYLARQYRQHLFRRTGTEPTLVVSELADAKEELDRYRDGTSKWIVAVKMVSEGVDIPRLAVGVWATRAATPLFFRQVVGRFVRVREHDELFNSRLFLPATPDLLKFGREIEEELRHQLELELDLVHKAEAEAGEVTERGEYPKRDVLSASPAVWDRVVLSKEDLIPEEVATAAEWCRKHGIPPTYAANVALGHRNELGIPIPQPASSSDGDREQATPKFKAIRLLKQEITTLVNAVARNRGLEHKDVNTLILIQGYPKRDKCSYVELEGIKAFLLGENAGG